MLLSLPRVIGPERLAAPAALLTSAPPAEMPVPFRVTGSAPMACPFKSRTAPFPATVVPPAVVPKAAALPSLSVPALINVAPV